ncbi:hypothetical protein [Rhizosphaericola mali]|uniref:Uncharacterized protein n=1 Tax=Rhizosphaericola mali TaxID=2545455 RepID=A0A5P2GBT6_9BACT|nr:hypothetical protein [Rhizosphaericola mali]QES90673.1 hypothetical protein E0W69_019105 [Rhizosphaericola mali]
MDYNYKNYTLSIYTDEMYSFDSADNKNSYDIVYPNGDYIFRQANMAICLKTNYQVIKSAILNVNSYFVKVYEKSIIIENNQFWILLANEMYCFELSTLHLLWKRALDISTNLAIYELDNDFLVHGEMEIFRVTKMGDIVWQFSGRDIWVSLKEKEVLKIEKGKIYLTDFNNDEYIIDFAGNNHIIS